MIEKYLPSVFSLFPAIMLSAICLLSCTTSILILPYLVLYLTFLLLLRRVIFVLQDA